MATSSSSSSQGSAPGVLGKGQQTPGDLIIYSLEDLNGDDFKRFRDKLSDFSYGDKRPIPRGRLENVDWITTKNLLIDTYGEEGALDVTIEVLTLISQMGPAKVLQDTRAQHGKLKKTTSHDMRLSDFGKEYRASVEEMFQRIPEYNSCGGEAVSLQKRYTKLLMRKEHQKKEEKEQDLRSTGRGHLQIMEERSSDKYSPITIQDLFAPDEEGFIPKIVVLQGPAGIGKTMTSKKIMLDWASGSLYQDTFDSVFYLSCRELNTITENINLVGLLSRSCGLPCSGDLVSILKDPGSHRKLLFLVDGFDELRWTLGKKSEVCHDVSEETHKEILLQSLLRKQIVQQSSLIITTRSLAMKKLNTVIDDYRCVEIQGFTRKDREEYVHKFFVNAEDAAKALRIIRDNDIVYAMCSVPVTCWIVCTVIQQEIKKDSALIRCKTMTSIYLLYLEVLLTHHSKEDQSVFGRPQAITTCLKKLCALANEGVLNQQILFKEEDLQRHGLSLREVESVFLNENIFHWDVRTQTCYSFIHLSVQEFLAALYYGLDGGSGFKKSFFLPKICKGNSLSALSSYYPHLALAVQFLFGLLNEKMVKTFSEVTGINISLRNRSVIKQWTTKDMNVKINTDVIVCLYEFQDEDFIRRVMSHRSHLEVQGTGYDIRGNVRNHSKELDYCLKALKSKSFLSLHFEDLTLDPECQKSLSLVVHRSRRVGFGYCTFHRRYGEDEGSSSSGHEMVPDILSSLIPPESKIEELSIHDCGLSSSSCDVLRSILITNRSLTSLDLSLNNLQDSGIKLLCEGLRHPDCTLQELRVYDRGVTFSCCDDLSSVITTNRTLTSLDIILDDEKMSDSEVARCCEVLGHAGFSVYRWNPSPANTLISFFYEGMGAGMYLYTEESDNLEVVEPPPPLQIQR
ncbi:PREDICTED: NACHT, LRR and PYD domains-containing protein 3-like [Nanorana parkeri]|uniref:NACHT, LRR and PYD domains-containing protein 3-like n=1 Tax=Nanorana parkeri TaxID=125878 RepID=UPI0008545487|nr:PREDICTED: NACHT, LRR and PYD domains-containing protein 3-like [Nanorana parkeri]